MHLSLHLSFFPSLSSSPLSLSFFPSLSSLFILFLVHYSLSIFLCFSLPVTSSSSTLSLPSSPSILSFSLMHLNYLSPSPSLHPLSLFLSLSFMAPFSLSLLCISFFLSISFSLPISHHRSLISVSHHRLFLSFLSYSQHHLCQGKKIVNAE